MCLKYISLQLARLQFKASEPRRGQNAVLFPMLLIEEPEAHLHPSLQCKLLRRFVRPLLARFSAVVLRRTPCAGRGTIDQRRSASVVAASAPRSRLALWNLGTTEANAAVPVAGVVVEAERRTHAPRAVVPAPATQHPDEALLWSGRVNCCR